MVKKFLFIVFVYTHLWGLSFAPMGNVSSSLGGAGVALRNSAWGLYYNPALLASDPRSKFSFNAGFWNSKSDLNPLLGISNDVSSEEIQSIFASLKNPRANLQVQMGVVAQIGGFFYEKNIASLDDHGRLVGQTIKEEMSAFAIGAFAASQVDITFNSAGDSNYDQHSFGVALMEIPIGYAYRYQTSFGDFNFGATIKYMRAVFDFSTGQGDVHNGISIALPNFLNMTPAHSFGIDLGFLYSIADVHLGLSAKNINLPTFKVNQRKLILNPGLRFGLAYEFLKHYAITMDIDLLSQSFSASKTKNQMFALGVIGDYKFVDFRVGLGLDMLNFKESKIALGFNAFGILDIVGEMGFNFAQKSNFKLKIPTNFGFRIGSTFTF